LPFNSEAAPELGGVWVRRKNLLLMKGKIIHSVLLYIKTPTVVPPSEINVNYYVMRPLQNTSICHPERSEGSLQSGISDH